MGTKTVNTCTAPDGTVFTRTSSSGRGYKYAVIGRAKDGWAAICWNSRRDLAERERAARATWWLEALVVPVTSVEKTTKDRPPVSFPGEKFEVEGLSFSVENGTAKATYRDYYVEVWRTETAFKARAYSDPTDWRDRLYAEKGGLESRVKAIKAAVDAKLEG